MVEGWWNLIVDWNQFLRFRGTWIDLLGRCIQNYLPDAGSICVSMVQWHHDIRAFGEVTIHCWMIKHQICSLIGPNVATILFIEVILLQQFSAFARLDAGFSEVAIVIVFGTGNGLAYLFASPWCTLPITSWSLEPTVSEIRPLPSQGTQGSVMSGCKRSQIVWVGSANWDNGRRSTACKQENIRMGLRMTGDWVERWDPPGEQSLYMRSVDLVCNTSASLSWCVQM